MTRVATTGMTGTGKTVYATRKFNEYKDLKIFFNIQHEDYPIKAVKTAKIDMITFEYNAYNYLITDVKDIQTLWPLFKALQIERMKHNPEARLLIVIDETDEFCSIYHKEKDPQFQTMRDMAKRSRRWNVDIIWIVQRPQELNNVIWTQCDKFIFYYMDPGDFEYIASQAHIKLPYKYIENPETGTKEKRYLVEEHCEPPYSFKYAEYDRIKFTYHEKIDIDWGKNAVHKDVV